MYDCIIPTLRKLSRIEQLSYSIDTNANKLKTRNWESQTGYFLRYHVHQIVKVIFQNLSTLEVDVGLHKMAFQII